MQKEAEKKVDSEGIFRTPAGRTPAGRALWFGAFGMKVLHFLCVAFLGGVWGMTPSDFCCVAMPPFECQRRLSNRDMYVVCNPSETIVLNISFLVRFSCKHSWLLRLDAQASKSFFPSQGRTKTPPSTGGV